MQSVVDQPCDAGAVGSAALHLQLHGVVSDAAEILARRSLDVSLLCSLCCSAAGQEDVGGLTAAKFGAVPGFAHSVRVSPTHVMAACQTYGIDTAHASQCVGRLSMASLLRAVAAAGASVAATPTLHPRTTCSLTGCPLSSGVCRMAP